MASKSKMPITTATPLTIPLSALILLKKVLTGTIVKQLTIAQITNQTSLITNKILRFHDLSILWSIPWYKYSSLFFLKSASIVSSSLNISWATALFSCVFKPLSTNLSAVCVILSITAGDLSICSASKTFSCSEGMVYCFRN